MGAMREAPPRSWLEEGVEEPWARCSMVWRVAPSR